MKPAASIPPHSPVLSRRELELLEAVCDGAELGIAWLDSALLLAWCGCRFSEWFPRGLPPTPEPAEHGWEAAAQATLAEGTVHHLLLHHECAAGGTRWYRLTFRPWNGGVLVVVVDTTLERHVEEGILRSERLQHLGGVAAGVAHDFNNYLTGILGIAGLLKEALPAGGEEGQMVSRLEAAAHTASGLARQILDYTRDDSEGQGHAELCGCVEGVAALLRHTLDPRIEVRTEQPDEEVWVALSAGRVQQVVMNLCCNARDAMPAGGTLELSVWAHGERATLRVRDTGMGMTAEVRERIFDPFFTTKGPGQGTGLGLAMCREIVLGAGGEMRVESAPGEGSLFEIHLPLERAARRLARTPPEATPEGGEPGGTVLVVDDEPLVRMVAERFLRRAGYTVVAADGGQAALEILHREGSEIDLLLLDLTMPGMRGAQVVAAVRAFLPDLPVVITSGYSEQSVTGSTWAHAVQGFLAKPFDRKSLLAAVRRARLSTDR